jgi:ribosomal protein S18 acetylase RimI-like enzyme
MIVCRFDRETARGRYRYAPYEILFHSESEHASMIEPAIRTAKPADVPAIRRIADDAWRAAYGQFLPGTAIDAAMSEWYDPDVVRDAIEREDGGYFVADVEGAVAGYVSGGPDEEAKIATLGAINVDPDRWGEGIGSALLSAFESDCRERGSTAVRARVLAKNDVGQPFYRKHGYETVEKQEAALFGVTVRERIFRRSL